ncbi:MAG: hypothetical protein ABI878_02080 [Acidobacteriota bacterium]
MPATLFDLYRRSDVIFEARYARTEDGDIVRKDEGYTVVKTKKHFDVYSTLKGSSSKFFELTEDEYRYSGDQNGKYLVARSGGEAQEDVEITYGLRSGDSVLLFLKFGDDGRTLDLANDDEGVKKLSSDDIDVYRKRINELSAILSAPKVTPETVNAWLIRCAEEPATRWEATFELAKGYERLEYQEKQPKPTAQNKESSNGMIVSDEVDALDSSSFARALTVDQKGKLANILLDRRPLASGDSVRTLVRGDRELIDLVKHWGDPRLAGFLLEELKTKELTDYRRSETMRLIADILRDPRIESLASEYSNAYRDEALASEMFRDQIPAATTATEKDAMPDYKQTRSTVIAKFIRRASAVVAGQSNTEN